jgi:hypothetical protein
VSTITVTGPSFHLEGPALLSSAFFAATTSFAALSTGTAFSGRSVAWTNDGKLGTVCDFIVVYATASGGVDGTMRFTRSTGGAFDMDLPGGEPKIDADWSVATAAASLTVAADVTVTILLKSSASDFVWIRSIDIIPQS